MQLALWTFLCKSAMGTEGYLVPLAPLSTFTLKPVALPSYSINPPYPPPPLTFLHAPERDSIIQVENLYSGFTVLILHSERFEPSMKAHPSCHFLCEHFWSCLWIESTPPLCPTWHVLLTAVRANTTLHVLGFEGLSLCPAHPYPASLIRL